jgi:hypothetical protein
MHLGEFPTLALGLVVLIAVLAIVAIATNRWAMWPRTSPPPYVADIQSGRVVIDNDSGQIKALLERSPYSEKVIDEPAGYLAVRFSDEGPDLDNPQLLQLLIWLNSQNIPFSVGKGWGPAEVMAHLRVNGRITGRFKTIYWTSPGKWHISDTYPDAA